MTCPRRVVARPLLVCARLRGRPGLLLLGPPSRTMLSPHTLQVLGCRPLLSCQCQQKQALKYQMLKYQYLAS